MTEDGKTERQEAQDTMAMLTFYVIIPVVVTVVVLGVLVLAGAF